MRPTRDPYASPEAPRERGGPVLRFAIVAALLGAAAWAFVNFSQGPGLTDTPQTEQQMADAGGQTASPPATIPEAAPPTEAPAPAAPARNAARPRAPAPATEPVPPPSTTTVPPG